MGLGTVLGIGLGLGIGLYYLTYWGKIKAGGGLRHPEAKYETPPPIVPMRKKPPLDVEEIERREEKREIILKDLDLDGECNDYGVVEVRHPEEDRVSKIVDYDPDLDKPGGDVHRR